MPRFILALDAHLTRVVWLWAAAILASISCLGLYQVLIRFVFNQPSPWSEELIGRLLIWCVALGLAAAFRQGALVSVDVMLRLSRGAWKTFVRRLILVVTLGFLVVLALVGVDLAWRIRFQTFSTVPLSMAWAYLALPVGALLSIPAVLAHYVDPQYRELETAQ